MIKQPICTPLEDWPVKICWRGGGGGGSHQTNLNFPLWQEMYLDLSEVFSHNILENMKKYNRGYTTKIWEHQRMQNCPVGIRTSSLLWEWQNTGNRQESVLSLVCFSIFTDGLQSTHLKILASNAELWEVLQANTRILMYLNWTATFDGELEP